MRLHKIVNRVHKGTAYYRWIVFVSPRTVRELGWADGQEITPTVRGSSLWLHPAGPSRPAPSREQIRAWEEQGRF
jgi:hypothetical protein